MKKGKLKENKKSNLPLFLSKDMSKSKLIFSVKNDKLNIKCGKRIEELAKNENNENIIIKRRLLGKKIKQNEIITSNIKISIKRGPYKRKFFGDFELYLDGKFFPFKLGKGKINITSKFNYELLQENKDSNNYNNISSLTYNI